MAIFGAPDVGAANAALLVLLPLGDEDPERPHAAVTTPNATTANTATSCFDRRTRGTGT
jgi:hypothetical protein